MATHKSEVDFVVPLCATKKDGVYAMSHMFEALSKAQSLAFDAKEMNKPITVSHILVLGTLVEPSNNGKLRNYRLQASKMGYSFAIPQDILNVLNNIVAEWSILSAEQVFDLFMMARPFHKGNKRVGVLLYNMKLNPYISLKMPPNVDDWEITQRA